MSRNVSLRVFLHMFLYIAFMVGYFLLLTRVLPQTIVYEPSWIKEGSFAQYNVEDSVPGMNGTYAWMIIAIENSSEGSIVTINETFEGTTHWTHVASSMVNIIPPSGRTTKTSASGGVIEGQVLWLLRYFNSMLVDRSYFLGNEYLGRREEKFSFQGTTRDAISVYPESGWTPPYYVAWYDKATGLFLSYWFSFRLGSIFVTLNSTNVFDSVNLIGENGAKAALDLFLVAPLLALPLAGAIVSLYSIRKRGEGFESDFWWVFILVNGTLIALLSNWPAKFSASPTQWDLVCSLFNVGFWVFIIGAAALIVNSFMFPIIAESSQNQLPTR